MIIWISGNSGSGKTTLAHKLKKEFKDNIIILDGDDLRTVWKLGFTKEDRWEQNLRAAKLAQILNNQGSTVIIATICPYKKLREEITHLINPVWIQLEGGKPSSEEYPYEK